MQGYQAKPEAEPKAKKPRKTKRVIRYSGEPLIKTPLTNGIGGSWIGK